MKQIIFVVFLFIAITMGLSDDVVERMAQSFSLPNIDVQICINKTVVKIEDLMKMDELVENSIQESSTDIDKSSSVLKIGCLLACLFQKKEMMSGAYINQIKLKEFLNTKMPRTDYETITKRDQILETCIDRVKSKTDECEVMLKFTLCVILEAKDYVGL
ncbi:uncharacterized protein LOC105258464 [Camponotus floridanus]|uniref:uncharacterized protein LOC105258464 n=1 Tax=Camponotus floridanus TaxID=104421 RepID=UPI000DC6CCE7|nr:uncharacterized protein LOC105258464 [Camponotus floridanus]XP_025269030.1 uncharacterized protein LOC105258464 [Camponotus floridanus]